MDSGAGNDMSVELGGDRIEDLAGGSGPEARLIEACRSGDEGAFNLLVWRWEKPLYNFIWKYVGDAALAEDLVQESFLRVLGSIRHYSHQGSFSTWLYRIAINLCKDHLKRRRLPMVSLHDFYTTASGERVYVQDRVADEGARTDEETETGRRAELVRRLLDALPEEERVVILLKEYQDLTFREIAQTLGVPEGTVKSRLYHGLRGMKESLARSGITGRAALGGAS